MQRSGSRHGHNSLSRMVADSLQPERSVGSSFTSTVKNCCRPLPWQLICLGVSLQGITHVFLALQMFYGLLLIILHSLLLAPPFNEPRCDWIPGSGPWMELLDLQWSLRIREAPYTTQTSDYVQVSARALRTSFNCAGTAFGLFVGVFTLLLACLVEISFSCTRAQSFAKPIEKLWLGFTTLQVAVFCACNLGKIERICQSTLVALADHNDETVVPDVTLPGQDTTSSPPPPPVPYREGPGLNGCGVMNAWFVEWTFMVTTIAGLGVWSCWSFVNMRIQTQLRADRRAEELQCDDEDQTPLLALSTF